MLEALDRLVRHMAWADAAALASLRHASPPGEALRLFGHVLAGERLWYLRMKDEDWTVQPVWPSLSLDACEALAAVNASTYAELLHSLDEPDLDRAVTYVNSKGVTYTNTVGDILLHVATHGAYHRGQVAAALRRAGVEPAYTDYIAFVR